MANQNQPQHNQQQQHNRPPQANDEMLERIVASLEARAEGRSAGGDSRVMAAVDKIVLHTRTTQNQDEINGLRNSLAEETKRREAAESSLLTFKDQVTARARDKHESAPTASSMKFYFPDDTPEDIWGSSLLISIAAVLAKKADMVEVKKGLQAKFSQLTAVEQEVVRKSLMTTKLKNIVESLMMDMPNIFYV